MSYSEISIAARRALLDALIALKPHRDALVLVGSQTIYLYTGPPAAGLCLASSV